MSAQFGANSARALERANTDASATSRKSMEKQLTHEADVGAVEAAEDLAPAPTPRPAQAPSHAGVILWIIFLEILLALAGLLCCYYFGYPGQVDTLGLTAWLLNLNATVREERLRVRSENDRLRRLVKEAVRPYEVITGSRGHVLPKMYGKVKEKTIWSYWHNPTDCPSASRCTLPPQVQLCVETVVRNKGSFDHRLLHHDEVEAYVSLLELPIHWKELKPPQQKDALMNALLGRYGGVALDISTILLRPLDDYWDEMVAQGAAFRGYMYRLNGNPWRHAEVTAVWFLMARRESIFSTAVRNQVIGMGDRNNTNAYHHWYLALGDQTLLPILTMFNYTLPKCHKDPTVEHGYHQFPDQNPEWCPENEQPPWYKGLTGPARNDTRIMLRDPRDGPQLPFAFMKMFFWHIDDDTQGDRDSWSELDLMPGSPMDQKECDTPRSCWRVFLERYQKVPRPGEARLLSFVKLFHHGSELTGLSREDLLADKQTFFYQWLKLAGLPL